MKSRTRIEDLTRREFVFGALGAVLLIACGDDDEDDSASIGEGRRWSFTDDRGVTVELPSRPGRIIAQEDAAAALWSFGIKPIATYGNAPLSDNPQFVDENLSGIESVGEVFGEIDIEKIIALDADLIVTTHWPTQGAQGMGFMDDEQAQRIASIAPIVAIEAPVPYRQMLNRYKELAASLGADLGSDAVVGALKELDAAFEALAKAAEATPDLQFLAVAGDAETLYIGNPGEFSDLAEYMTAGLSFVVPEDTAAFDGLWEGLSWEQAKKYAADVILYDGRAGSQTPDQLAESATWATLPAVQAGQTGAWYMGTTFRLSFFTQHVRELTSLLENSKKVI